MQMGRRTNDVRQRGSGTGARLRRREQDGRGWLGTATLGVLAAAGGAVAAFFLDPARGHGRRTRLVDQGGATLRRAARQSAHTLRRARASVSGSLAAAIHRDGGDPLLDDASLAAKVETELFRDPSVPKGAINVNVERGIVVLRGEVPDTTMRDRLANQAASIRGIWSVHNMLHLPGEPAERQPIGVTR